MGESEGTALVTAALARGAVGSYQLHAAIAARHDEAPSVERGPAESGLRLSRPSGF